MPSPSPMIRAHIFYSGKVQGVGFRYTTRRLAQQLGLSGWVRNLHDGRVEILAEGPRDGIEELTQRLDREFEGFVTGRDIDVADAEGSFKDFTIAF